MRTRFLTSSMAMTTSTVSKLSRPKSFEKCEVFESSTLGQPSYRDTWLGASYLGNICNLFRMLLALSSCPKISVLTLSKFFSRSIILPSTSLCERLAGAEYHLRAGGWEVGVDRADFDERQGVIKREVGKGGFAASLPAHHEDRRRAVLIMVYYGVL